jgi:hypothetical protein
VEVAASAQLLTTENAAAGTVIEKQRITDLPLNGRNNSKLEVSDRTEVALPGNNAVSTSLMPLLLVLFIGHLCQAQEPPDLRKSGWYAEWKAPVRNIGHLGGIGGTPTELGPMSSFDALAALRHSGAATFADSLHAGLPFDLAAARLVDGLVVTDDRSLALWSLLLDHGYALAPIAGAGAKMYVHCPDGLNESCPAEAIRHQRTVVSTGPLLTAVASGKNQIEVQAWPGQGRLLRIELWAHNRVIDTRPITDGQPFTGTLTWTPAGPGDWIAVRAISDQGWALSSAFFSEIRQPVPLTTRLKMVFPEIASQQQAGAVASIFDFSPGLNFAKRIQEIEMERNELEVDAPVTAVVRIELADGRRIDTRLHDASGVRSLLEDLKAAPLEWSVYEEVLRRCRRVSVESRF